MLKGYIKTTVNYRLG